MTVYQYPDAVTMVFCKAPVPGAVKTRLLPAVSADEAARLHCELSRFALTRATKHKLCKVQLWCSPSCSHPFFSELAARYPVTLHEQQGADLGARMQHAFDSAFSHYRRAVLIGCDCPSLTHVDLAEALAALAMPARGVLSPAEDGGYVLIGLNRPQPELFKNMPWGTEQVLSLTLAKLRQLNLEAVQLSCQWDVDTPEDLARYRVFNPHGGSYSNNE
jgi:rSAM/selenodomain-associated transferase 1